MSLPEHDDNVLIPCHSTYDETAKSPILDYHVFPALNERDSKHRTGIQLLQWFLDPGFHRGDDTLTFYSTSVSLKIFNGQSRAVLCWDYKQGRSIKQGLIPMISVIASFLVGCVFLITGVAKVVYSRPFIAHIRNLGVLPRSLNEVAASLFIQLECGVGAALVLSIFPTEFLPILAGLILALSILSVWGVKSGRVENCGCYGGWVTLSLKQSLGLNILYLLLLLVSWWMQEISPPVMMWKIWVIVGLFILSNFLIRRSANSPLIDISPIRSGRRWQPKWSNLSELNEAADAYLYIFMTHHCQLCKSWEPYIMNLLGQQNTPLPVLIFPEVAKDTDIWDERVLQQTLTPGTFRYLIYQTPTAVLVRNGLIENKWVAHFPDEYV